MANPAIEIVPSALKHKGITKADICEAVGHCIYNSIMDDEPNKNLLIGFDAKMRLLEVMYNELADGTIHIFHAMKCRPKYMAIVGL